MKIYSYFHPVADLNVEDELRLSILWRRRWSDAGFEPIILNEWHAQQHPYYAEFAAAVSKLPSCNPVQYERACYLRWLALAQVGGGFMADLDVFPTAHLTKELRTDPYKVIIFQVPCCPSFVACSSMLADQLCLEFATANIGNRPQGERPHYSDQYAIEDLVKGGADWIEIHDVCKQWPDAGWEVAPLVHFPSAAMSPRNRSPKWKHIPSLLDSAVTS